VGVLDLLALRMVHSSCFAAYQGLATSTIVCRQVNNIGIVGGGLAGLSTAFHMLQKTNGACHITIYDKGPVGTGGASSVAGGLLHPLSPRGKIVHWGLEGLIATNSLLDHAVHKKPGSILRNELYRVATTEKNVADLKRSAKEMPEFCEWMDDMEGCQSDTVMGGLRLHNGCKVLHVPTYLEGLWLACCDLGTVEWKIGTMTRYDNHDVVVLAAGAGLWNDQLLSQESDGPYPMDLVRGQSIDLIVKDMPLHAILAGKYMTPLPDPYLCHVGATQEQITDLEMTPRDLYDTLLSQTSFLSLWSSNPAIHRISSGIRVQSRRSHLGRLPMIGQIGTTNTYLFSGLSSRGLLYHGIYGDLLTDAILGRRDVTEEHPHLNWWRSKAEPKL